MYKSTDQNSLRIPSEEYKGIFVSYFYFIFYFIVIVIVIVIMLYVILFLIPLFNYCTLFFFQ